MSQSLVKVNVKKLMKRKLDSSSEDLHNVINEKLSESSDVEVTNVEVNTNVLLKENRPMVASKNNPKPKMNRKSVDISPTKKKSKTVKKNEKTGNTSESEVKKNILKKDNVSLTINNNNPRLNSTKTVAGTTRLKENNYNLRNSRNIKSINSSDTDNSQKVLPSSVPKDNEERETTTEDLNQNSHQLGKGPLLSIEFVRNNKRAIEFYTGLQDFEKFLLVFQTLKSDVSRIQYYYSNEAIPLTHQDQFFMTLILLKLQKSHYEISILFDISLREIKNIFITWVKFMSMEWSGLQFPNLKITFKSKDSTNDKGQKQKNSNNEEANSEISDEVRIIDWKNLSDTDKSSFKKVYKVLNGPQNYMERHLMNEIIAVCHTLCFFKTRKNDDLKKYCT